MKVLPTELHFAAQRGDVALVRKLISSGMDVNRTDENGNTPLKYAAAEPHPDVLRELLSLGAGVNIADRRGFTPLHCVAAHGFYPGAIEMAELLMEAGAIPNARSTELGFVPLHEVRTTEMIALLVRYGADPAVRSDDGQTPEEYLREDGCLAEAEYLRKLVQTG